MNAYIVLVGGDRHGAVEAIGPFPAGAHMDAWIAEHDSDLDDWRDWSADIRGGYPKVALIDELSATAPAQWLANWETEI